MGRVLFFAIVAVTAAIMLWLVVGVVDARRTAEDHLADAIPVAGEPLGSLPQDWLEILLKVEDPTFFENKGIDLSSDGAGLTTLSQGLAKRLFYERFRPGVVKQNKLRLMLQTRYGLVPAVPRDAILNGVLNLAYMGHGPGGAIIGFEAAAGAYYGKPLLDLNRQEWIGLVAVLPAPNAVSPLKGQEQHRERILRIERLMAGSCAPDGLRDVWLEGCAAP